MEYFIGSIVTLIVFSALLLAIKMIPQSEYAIKIQSSQSYFYSIAGIHAVSDYINYKETQSSKYLENIFLKVFVTEGKAYWIKDNRVYVAEMIGKAIDNDTATEVDMMSMDSVQLKKMLFIIDKLKER